MEDDSPGDPGRRPHILERPARRSCSATTSEATLRDEIEEAIESREGEAPQVGDLSHVERQMLRNLLHFGEKTAGDVAVPRGDIIAVPTHDQLRRAGRRLRRGRPQPPAGLSRTASTASIGMIHIKDVFAVQVDRRGAARGHHRA